MPKSPARAASKKAAKSHAAEAREIIYQEVESRLCIGENAVTAEAAKKLLGWEEESDAAKFGGSFLLKDAHGNKVRCRNNVTNRPLYSNVLQSLKQEHLRRRWRMNGEPLIIGRTGLVLNGQHQMISLVLATQEWEADREKWGTYWESAPTMDKLVVYGIDEGDATVNTMDTCKPRSLADVIYRSEYFASMKEHDRRVCARMTDYAIRLLWHRTGAGLDAFAPRRTHSESLDFIARHPRILECVKHVYEENCGNENRVGLFVSPGYAAGLLYLMGCSATDPAEYGDADTPSEAMLDWSQWDKASDFIVLMAGGNELFKPVKAALAALLETGAGSNAERWALLVNAWCAYVENGTITPESLQLEFVQDDEGGRHLADTPTVGGIDLGDPSEADEEVIRASDPSPEQIEERCKVEQTKRKKAAKKAALLKPSRAGDDWAEGDVAWVYDQDGEHYLGKLLGDPEDGDDGVARVMVEAHDGEWEVNVDDLHLKQPAPPAKAPQPMMGKKPSHRSLPPAKHAKVGDAVKVGRLVWVAEKSGEPWRGRVVEINQKLKVAKLRVEQGFQGSGNVRTAPLTALSAKQPRLAAA